MIRFLIDTTVARRDSSGNCYNFSTVTSAKTGRSLIIHSGYGSDGGNIKAMLRKAGLDWSEIHYTEKVIAIREYNRCKKFHTDFCLEHLTTGDMLLALERKSAIKK